MQGVQICRVLVLIVVLAIAGLTRMPGQAQDELAYGDTIALTVQPDIEYAWTFTGAAGDRVIMGVLMADGGDDLFINLQDPEGYVLDYHTGLSHYLGEYGSIRTGLVLPVDGQYTIIIQNREVTAETELMLTFNRVQDMALPNLPYNQPTAVVLNTGETQPYMLQPEAGELVVLRMSSLVDLTTTTLFPVLWVGGQASLGQEWGEGCASPLGYWSYNAKIPEYTQYCQFVATGEEIVIVAGAWPYENMIPESLTLTLIAERPEVRFLKPSTPLHGELQAGQEIYYAFEATADDMITVRVTSSFVPEISLRGTYGLPIDIDPNIQFGANQNTVSISNADLSSDLFYSEVPGGTYYLVVTESGGEFDEPTGGRFEVEFSFAR